MATSDNARFLRSWAECDVSNIDFSCSNPIDLKSSVKKWFPYNKGGEFRKWYGNNELVVNWESDGKEMRHFTSTLPQGTFVRLKSREFYCYPCITYSSLSSGDFGCRVSDAGFLFDTKGSCIFGENEELYYYSGLLNSKVSKLFLSVLCPTLDFSMVGIKQIPIKDNMLKIDCPIQLQSIFKEDWDFYELSWGFKKNPLVDEKSSRILSINYRHLTDTRIEKISKAKSLEIENNSYFINFYGLQDELTPDVPLSEITLTCNPHYRYGGNLSDEEREARLQSDTIAELVSYAIGCMMGRYSLDREGLVYAHAGNVGFNDLVAEGAYKTFAADGDGILPLTAYSGEVEQPFRPT